MAVVDDLFAFINSNWGKKLDFISGTVDPLVNGLPNPLFTIPFVSSRLVLYLNTSTNIVWSWNGQIWTEGLGGGGLDEVDWSIIQNKPSTFTPSVHTHPQSQITGLETDLANIGNLIANHEASTNNPHGVTKAQVGLSNVDNTSDLNKPISNATQAALNLKSNVGHTHIPSEVGLGNVPNVDATDADNIVENTTKRFVSDTEKTTWNAKQNAISFNADVKTFYDGSGTFQQLLDTNGKFLLSKIPDTILGQLIFGGTVDMTNPLDIVANLSTSGASKASVLSGNSYSAGLVDIVNDSNQGSNTILGYDDAESIFFIISAVAIGGTTFAGKVFQVGDWLLSTGTSWEKVDNTDLVTSVNGQIGAVIVASPEKNINISVPYIGEIPITINAYEPFTSTFLSHKTAEGTCTFYIKRVRGASVTYFTHDIGLDIIQSSTVAPSPSTQNNFASSTTKDTVSGGSNIPVAVNDYLAIVITSVSTTCKMFSLSLKGS